MQLLSMFPDYMRARGGAGDTVAQLWTSEPPPAAFLGPVGVQDDSWITAPRLIHRVLTPARKAQQLRIRMHGFGLHEDNTARRVPVPVVWRVRNHDIGPRTHVVLYHATLHAGILTSEPHTYSTGTFRIRVAVNEQGNFQASLLEEEEAQVVVDDADDIVVLRDDHFDAIVHVVLKCNRLDVYVNNMLPIF